MFLDAAQIFRLILTIKEGCPCGAWLWRAAAGFKVL
jgi:hypothetical protein